MHKNCNCSEGDIFSESASLGFYMTEIPQVVFVDPQSPTPLWQLIAHELIHDIQKIFYNDMDFDSDYLECLQEKMAFNLEKKVGNWIKRELLGFDIILEGNSEIFEFQLERYRKHEEEKILKEIEIEEKTKSQRLLMDYFYENEEKHYNNYPY